MINQKKLMSGYTFGEPACSHFEQQAPNLEPPISHNI